MVDGTDEQRHPSAVGDGEKGLVDDVEVGGGEVRLSQHDAIDHTHITLAISGYSAVYSSEDSLLGKLIVDAKIMLHGLDVLPSIWLQRYYT